jgi:cation diffusion facilitator CzcD-associated flavoprotein CzcO
MPHREDWAVAEQVRECEVVVVGAGYSGLVAPPATGSAGAPSPR